MKQRMNEIILGICAVLFFALVAFNYSEFPDDPGITGYITNLQDHRDIVVHSGEGFTAIIDGYTYYLIFDGEAWYRSTGGLDWEHWMRGGDSVWIGLSYLKFIDAEIYAQNGEQIEEILEYAQLR